MVRRRLGLILLAATVAGFSFAQQQPPAAPPDPIHSDERLKDVYAIYSLLMPGAVFTNMGPDKNQQWAIADTTITIDDMSPALAPDAALRAPEFMKQSFREALGSFRILQHNHLPIIRAFHLDRPYVLLTDADVAAFRTARSSATPDSDEAQKYSAYPGINFFSDVYFDTQRSAALVYRLDWCGSLCSQGEWIYLEKRDGAWVVRSGQKAIAPGAQPF